MRTISSSFMVGLIVAVNGLISFGATFAFGYIAPDAELTPGLICTSSDPDFKGYDYPDRVARCNRNVSFDQKLRIAHSYGDIPREDWHNYEFDHLIPLCAGGSNDSRNIWPQPLDQAKKKDVLEHEICSGLREGTLTQTVAVQRVHDWFAALKFNQGDSTELNKIH